MKPKNSLYSALPTTIFEKMSALSRGRDVVNLGQGFPDVDGPEAIRQACADETLSGFNQYPPLMGVTDLRDAVAEANQRFYGLDVSADNVMVTSGATEALASCLYGLINPGDEVVLIEPLYDSYLPVAKHAGAVIKSVRLEPPHWHLDLDALEAAFSYKTKLIVLNTPHNPTGKIFTDEELSAIAGLLEKYDAYAVCDEVYEHITFDGLKHVPLMTYPGMFERCLRIGSAGKTFSLTGWKIGYVTGPLHLIQAVAKTHQFLCFTTPPNLQVGIAAGLRLGDDFFQGVQATFQAHRDLLVRGLQDIGFETSETSGSYFVVADTRSVGFSGDDREFCEMLVKEAGVVTIPLYPFYVDNPPENLVRFSFSKSEPTLRAGLERLKAYF